MRVGLVLGAGGVAGHAFHAGVLHAIHEVTGWDARNAAVIVGTSAGSIVGTGLRAGLSPADAYARVVGDPMTPPAEAILASVPTRSDDDWRRRVDGARRPFPASPRLLARLATQPWKARPSLVLAGLLPPGRLDPTPIGEDIDAVISVTGFDHASLRVVTVRLADGRRTVFGGDAGLPDGATWGDAVAASCSIPGVFAPVEVGDEPYVDGGAHSPTNADLLADDDLDLVIVSSPMSSARRSAHRGLDAPVRAGYRLRLAAELRRLRPTPVVSFQPTGPVLRKAGLNAMDPSIRVPVARAAYDAARTRLFEQPDLFGGRLGEPAPSSPSSGAGGR